MVKRFIVRCEQERYDNRVNQRLYLISILIGLCAFGVSLQLQDTYSYCNWFTTPYAIAAIGILFLSYPTTLLLKSTWFKEMEQGVAVFIYPLGIQLATIVFKSSEEMEQQQFHLVKPGRFLPHDQIIDCVVNEVILAHKVVSVVVFRIQQSSCNSSSSSSNTSVKDVKLINAFPGVELTYNECLTMRHKIMIELR